MFWKPWGNIVTSIQSVPKFPMDSLRVCNGTSAWWWADGTIWVARTHGPKSNSAWCRRGSITIKLNYQSKRNSEVKNTEGTVAQIKLQTWLKRKCRRRRKARRRIFSQQDRRNCPWDLRRQGQWKWDSTLDLFFLILILNMKYMADMI